MKRKGKRSRVGVGEVVSFKVPDQKTADLINKALRATNATKARLSLDAFLIGVGEAAWNLCDGRDSRYGEFQAALKQYGPLTSDPAANEAVETIAPPPASDQNGRNGPKQ